MLYFKLINKVSQQIQAWRCPIYNLTCSFNLKLNANKELDYSNGRKCVGCITEKLKQSSLLPAGFLVICSLFHYSTVNKMQKMTISFLSAFLMINSGNC